MIPKIRHKHEPRAVNKFKHVSLGDTACSTLERSSTEFGPIFDFHGAYVHNSDCANDRLDCGRLAGEGGGT
jgi:hypothetical protein